MGENWTEEKIANYKRSSEYTGFHKKLSVYAEPYLDEHWEMADIGCGPGLIDFYLAPSVKSITAIDKDEFVIQEINKQLDEVFYTNRDVAEKITPMQAELKDLDGMEWDVIMLNFFGVTEDILKELLPKARKRFLLFMVGRKQPEAVDMIKQVSSDMSYYDVESFLNREGYAYKKSSMDLQMGQPFKKIEEIHEFLKGYDNGDPAEFERKAYAAEERIVKTNRFDYPFYLPSSINIIQFIIVKSF